MVQSSIFFFLPGLSYVMSLREGSELSFNRSFPFVSKFGMLLCGAVVLDSTTPSVELL